MHLAFFFFFFRSAPFAICIHPVILIKRFKKFKQLDLIFVFFNNMTEICWAFYGACKLRELQKIIFHEASDGSLALEQKSDANLLTTEEKQSVVA